MSLEFCAVVENAAIAAARTMVSAIATSRRSRRRSHAQNHGLASKTALLSSVKANATKHYAVIGEKSVSPHTLRTQISPPWTSRLIRSKGQSLRHRRGQTPSPFSPQANARSLHAPDLYMEKIVVGPSCKGAVDLDAPVSDQSEIHRQASRPRRGRSRHHRARSPAHEKLIEAIRKAGARIRLIGDGDLSAEFPPLLLALVFTPSWELAERRKACSPRPLCAV